VNIPPAYQITSFTMEKNVFKDVHISALTIVVHNDSSDSEDSEEAANETKCEVFGSTFELKAVSIGEAAIN